MSERIVWGITGAGDYLEESLSAVKRLKAEMGLDVTVIASRSAEIVLRWYGLLEDIGSSVGRIRVERGPNRPFIAGPLQTGYYSLLFVSPATANTTAKIAHGIADSLITNCVAQAVKGSVPVYIFPVDQRPGEVVTRLPKGDTITIRTRRIDVENAETLSRMEGIRVLGHPREILDMLSSDPL